MGQITPDQLQALLNYASRRLGTTPEQLAHTVQHGGLEAMAGGIGPDTARRVQELVGDPQQAQQFLNRPEVRALLQKLGGDR